MKKIILYVFGFFFVLFVFELFVTKVDRKAVQALTSVKEIVSQVAMPKARKPVVRELTPQKLAHWQSKVAKVATVLPTMKAEQNSNPHEMPMELATIAVDLADLETAFIQYPALEQTAVSFYDSCIRKADLLPAVRALCLHHMAEFSKKSGRGFSYANFPADVVKLESAIR